MVVLQKFSLIFFSVAAKQESTLIECKLLLKTLVHRNFADFFRKDFPTPSSLLLNRKVVNFFKAQLKLVNCSVFNFLLSPKCGMH